MAEMANMARKTDEHMGVCDHGAPCCPHSVRGAIVGGSPDVFADGLAVARLGDAVVHDCPHCGTGFISGASATVFANGRGVARLGDRVTYPSGDGVITVGSGKTYGGG